MGLSDPDQKDDMANQPNTVVVDKKDTKAVVVDVRILSDSNIRKKEHKKLNK